MALTRKDNINSTTVKGTSFSKLRLGNVQDIRDLRNVPQVGVPFGLVPVLEVLDGPNAADPDFFVQSTATTSTGALTVQDVTMQTNPATGAIFARNLSVTLGSQTGANVQADIVVTNIYGDQVTISFDSGDDGTTYYIPVIDVVSATITQASSTGTITIGFGDEFALAYPCRYGIGVSFSAADADPAIVFDGTATFTFADLSLGKSGTTDHHYGSVLLSGGDQPDGTSNYYIMYFADPMVVADPQNAPTDDDFSEV